MNYTYDPVRQLNVLPDGTAVIDTPAVIGSTMSDSSRDRHGRQSDDG